MLRTVPTTLKVAGRYAMGLALGVAVAQVGYSQAPCADGSCGGHSHVTANYGYGGYGAAGNYDAMLGRGTQPVFDNYFTRGYANQAEAGMYMSPVGVPGWVGHTYNTYQPFNPHNYLYQHHDRYHSYYDDGRCLNRTSAKYYAPPARSAAKRAYKFLEIPR